MHNSITKNLPYGYTNEDVKHLLEPSPIEIDLFMSGERFKAVKLYSMRNKLKDLKLASWLFLTISKKAYDIKNTMKNVFGVEDNEFLAEHLVMAEELVNLEDGKWNFYSPKKLKPTNKKKSTERFDEFEPYDPWDEENWDD